MDCILRTKKGARWGRRDSTMILVAYQHGPRASELTNLRGDQIDFATATLHVRRVKQETAGAVAHFGELCCGKSIF